MDVGERLIKPPRTEEDHMVILPHVIDRQPYLGNPAVRDEKGGLRKRGYGSRTWVLRESWSEAIGLRNGSCRWHPNRPPDPEGARVAFLSQSPSDPN